MSDSSSRADRRRQHERLVVDRLRQQLREHAEVAAGAAARGCGDVVGADACRAGKLRVKAARAGELGDARAGVTMRRAEAFRRARRRRSRPATARCARRRPARARARLAAARRRARNCRPARRQRAPDRSSRECPSRVVARPAPARRRSTGIAAASQSHGPSPDGGSPSRNSGRRTKPRRRCRRRGFGFARMAAAHDQRRGRPLRQARGPGTPPPRAGWAEGRGVGHSEPQARPGERRGIGRARARSAAARSARTRASDASRSPAAGVRSRAPPQRRARGARAGSPKRGSGWRPGLPSAVRRRRGVCSHARPAPPSASVSAAQLKRDRERFRAGQAERPPPARRAGDLPAGGSLQPRRERAPGGRRATSRGRRAARRATAPPARRPAPARR